MNILFFHANASVQQSIIRLYWAALSCIWLHWDVLDCTWLYLALLGCTGMLSAHGINL